MTSPVSKLTVALSLIAVAGCVGIPTPEAVVQSCSRDKVSIEASGRASTGSYHKKEEALCETDEMQRTSVSTKVQGNTRGGTASAEYKTRDGDESTKAQAERSFDRCGSTTRVVVTKVRENKYLRWGSHLEVNTGAGSCR